MNARVVRRAIFYAYLGYWLAEITSNEKTQHHLTLWLNLSFVLYFSIDLTSKFELWFAHMASFVSSYTLAVGYLILLYFVGKGDIAVGFHELDVVKNEQNATYALVRSFVLHFLPIALFHIDLHVSKASLIEAYAGRSYLTNTFSVLSAFVIPLVYEQVQLRRLNGEHPAIILYGVDKGDFQRFDLVTKGLNLAIVLPLVVAFVLHSLPVAAHTRKMTATARSKVGSPKAK